MRYTRQSNRASENDDIAHVPVVIVRAFRQRISVSSYHYVRDTEQFSRSNRRFPCNARFRNNIYPKIIRKRRAAFFPCRPDTSPTYLFAYIYTLIVYDFKSVRSSLLSRFKYLLRFLHGDGQICRLHADSVFFFCSRRPFHLKPRGYLAPVARPKPGHIDLVVRTVSLNNNHSRAVRV